MSDLPGEIASHLPFAGAVTNIHAITKLAAPWPEVAAFRLVKGEHSVRLSVRCDHPSMPVNLIDFIGYESEPETDLVVVYLNAATTQVDKVPSRYVLGNDWKSVTHLYYAGDHEYGDGPPPAKPAESASAQRGGLRLNDEKESAPLVSIVTIVYNGADLIEQTIQSVLHGKADDIEYVILDGASTDETLAVVSRYREYIDYWQSEPDEGIYDALNSAIALCRGTYVGAIHANDLYYPGWESNLRRAISSYPDDEFFFGKLRYSDSSRSWVRGDPINSLFEVVVFGYFNHPTCFIRRLTYKRLGNYNQKYFIAGDYDLGIRFWKAGVRFRFIDAVMSCFRLGGTSSSLWVNQWQRHQVRVANGENGLYSFGILLLVIANYWIKAPLRWIRR